MSRKKTQPKKNIVPDPKYNSTIIPKLINNIMYDGKRGVASKIVYDAIEKIKTKFINPLSIAPHRKQSNISLKSMKISPFLKIKATHHVLKRK